MCMKGLISYKVEGEGVEIDLLDEEELRKIMKFDSGVGRLEGGKDMLVFGWLSGVS